MIAYIWLQQRLKVPVPQVLHCTNLLCIPLLLESTAATENSCVCTCLDCTPVYPLVDTPVGLASSSAGTKYSWSLSTLSVWPVPRSRAPVLLNPTIVSAIIHCHHHYCDHKPHVNTDTRRFNEYLITTTHTSYLIFRTPRAYMVTQFVI